MVESRSKLRDSSVVERSAVNADVTGSNPVLGAFIGTVNADVTGSNPVLGANYT